MSKKVKYKFDPKIAVIARNQSLVLRTVDEAKILKAVVKGQTYEEIAAKEEISVDEVAAMAKAAMRRWGSELGHNANEARSLDLRRLDALLNRLTALVFPEPCINNETGLLELPETDYPAIKLYLEIIKQRAAIYGYEAKDKLKETDTSESLRREYVGVKLNSKGEIDL